MGTEAPIGSIKPGEGFMGDLKTAKEVILKSNDRLASIKELIFFFNQIDPEKSENIYTGEIEILLSGEERFSYLEALRAFGLKGKISDFDSDEVWQCHPAQNETDKDQLIGIDETKIENSITTGIAALRLQKEAVLAEIDTLSNQVRKDQVKKALTLYWAKYSSGTSAK